MSGDLPAPLFPVSLVVAGRPCLVVGAGPVGTRKATSLFDCGALVTVVAPDISSELRRMAAGRGDAGGLSGPSGALELIERPYETGEAVRYRLVVAATGNTEVDRAVCADAEAAGVWVNAADDPAACSFVIPAVSRRGPVTVAVSTQGTSPALARWLRDRLDAVLPAGLQDLAPMLEEARRQLRAVGRPSAALDWRGLLDGPVTGLVAAGKLDEARAVIGAALEALSSDTPS